MNETTNTTGTATAPGVIGTIESAGAAVLGAVEHPITTIEHAAGAAVAEVEKAAGVVKVELEDLTDKVRAYFHSTSGAHLQDALIAIATRVQALEATVSGLRDFIGK